MDRAAKLTLDQGANNLCAKPGANFAIGQTLAVIRNGDQQLLLLALGVYGHNAAAVGQPVFNGIRDNLGQGNRERSRHVALELAKTAIDQSSHRGVHARSNLAGQHQNSVEHLVEVHILVQALRQGVVHERNRSHTSHCLI
ncbi:unannotated protein [freshwater metagenome]|uniref:Unannotated protein n=1 Tax=freshwater metagenome TaxID=449393 RepID=A0A6J6IP71_9ZZZZ